MSLSNRIELQKGLVVSRQRVELHLADMSENERRQVAHIHAQETPLPAQVAPMYFHSSYTCPASIPAHTNHTTQTGVLNKSTLQYPNEL